MHEIVGRVKLNILLDSVLLKAYNCHLQTVKKKYPQNGQFIEGPEQPCEFESTEMKLDLTMEGTLLQGWKITPRIPPVVCH